MITSAARLMDFSFLFLLKNREKPAGYLPAGGARDPILTSRCRQDMNYGLENRDDNVEEECPIKHFRSLPV
jgi:hypothetical protein